MSYVLHQLDVIKGFIRSDIERSKSHLIHLQKSIKHETDELIKLEERLVEVEMAIRDLSPKEGVKGCDEGGVNNE